MNRAVELLATRKEKINQYQSQRRQSRQSRKDGPLKIEKKEVI